MKREAESFARTLERETTWSRQHARPFSLIVLSTQPGILAPERARLLDWGTTVLRNTAPEGARILAAEDESRCLMLIPGLDEADARAVAAYLEEQLNKLPVFGVAPGGGWCADFATYPYHAAAIRGMANELSSENEPLAVRGR